MKSPYVNLRERRRKERWVRLKAISCPLKDRLPAETERGCPYFRVIGVPVREQATEATARL